MALKDLIRNVRGKSQSTGESREHTVGDLVALGRLDEAQAMLERRLKRNSRDRHARLKLADLMMKQGRGADAVDQYLEVADGYATDGFLDKAHALLAKLTRLLPSESKLIAKMQRLERAKELERRRGVVSEAVREGGKIKTSAFAVQHLWSYIAKCSLVEELEESQLTKLFSQVAVVKLEEEERLVSAGEERHELFIVVQGEIAAQILLATGKRTDLRTFGSGDIVGENALLKRQAWPASYVAKRRTSMFCLDRSGVEALLVGEADPRGLLEALRSQGRDDEVALALSQLSQE